MNAKYVLALKSELELCGHIVDVLLTNCENALNHLMLVVLAEEIQRQKAAGQKNHGLGVKARADAFLKSGRGITQASLTSILGRWRRCRTRTRGTFLTVSWILNNIPQRGAL